MQGLEEAGSYCAVEAGSPGEWWSEAGCTGGEPRALVWWLNPDKNLLYCLSSPTTSPRPHDESSKRWTSDPSPEKLKGHSIHVLASGQEYLVCGSSSRRAAVLSPQPQSTALRCAKVVLNHGTSPSVNCP